MQTEGTDDGTLTVTGDIELLTMFTFVIAGLIGGEDAIDAAGDELEAALDDEPSLAESA